ncbi:MAG: peptide MFS transporter, partial [Myxococcales bacterium]|nr:peptide MFS transporter [Myxococcales bacterium]
FFAEMWERFSYYGMRALLVLYMIKGFLERSDSDAYIIYGAYTGLVYATPFIGGVLADQVLGARRAVVLGGLLMAAGHLVMTIESQIPFFAALALLIVGNGFFKPNISAIVGSLYPEGSPKRDSGFTIFYIGINLGAAMAPLLCGYVGEKFGWHYGFGLATIGMLVGLAVFILPAGVTRIAILATALASGGAMIYLNLDEVIYALGPNALVAGFLMLSGVMAYLAIGKGGLPEWAGQPRDLEKLKAPWLLGLSREKVVYIGAFAVVPLVAGAMLLDEKLGVLFTVLDIEMRFIGLLMIVIGAVALSVLFKETFASERVERDRLIVVLVMMFFSMLFWAFFEQAGSSINLFTDRNVDRVFETATVSEADVGKTIQVEVTQALNGRTMGDKTITMADIDGWRAAKTAKIDWPVSQDDVGMGTAGSEVATSQFQALNPIYIILFGLLFSALWAFLGKRGLEPSTPVKFGLGIAQLALGFGALWYGAQQADAFGIVGMSWLALSYLLITTGELCLSPVGLAMVTNLSPKRIVSMTMGAWFLATAFSNYLSAIIATFTGVGHGGGDKSVLPPPTETVHTYGEVFGIIAVVAGASALVVFVLSPLLSKMMHMDESELGGGGH